MRRLGVLFYRLRSSTKYKEESAGLLRAAFALHQTKSEALGTAKVVFVDQNVAIFVILKPGRQFCAGYLAHRFRWQAI